METEYMMQIWREGKQFAAHAMPPDVTSSGVTQEAARLPLRETVNLFTASLKNTEC